MADDTEALAQRVERQCACPSGDRFRCIAIRYPQTDFADDGRYDGDPEACQCPCHDEEDDGLDEWEVNELRAHAASKEPSK